MSYPNDVRATGDIMPPADYNDQTGDLKNNVHNRYLTTVGFANGSDGDANPADISIINDYDATELRNFTRIENISAGDIEPHLYLQFELSPNANTVAGKTLTIRYRLSAYTAEVLAMAMIDSAGAASGFTSVTSFTPATWVTSTFTVPAGTYTPGGRFQVQIIIEALAAGHTFDIAEVKIV